MYYETKPTKGFVSKTHIIFKGVAYLWVVLKEMVAAGLLFY